MKSTLLQGLFILGLLAAGGIFAQGQNQGQNQNQQGQLSPDEQKLLEGIRTGRIQVTDQMIEMQRRQHPELRNFSNQQIRAKLMEKARQQGQDTTQGQWDQGQDQNQNIPEWQRRQREEMQRRQRAGEQGFDSLDQQGQFPPQQRARPGRDTGEQVLGASRFPPGLKRFGYDFFMNNQFQPAGAAGGTPSLPEYVLSPGDEIQVYTWGRETQSQTIMLDNEGMFQYPPLAPMRVAGMRFADAQKRITAELEKINGMKASVGLGRLKSIRVMVLGEAMSPGSYVVQAGATVTSALFQSGGISDIGSLRAISVRRGGRTVATLDLYEMLLKGTSRGDIQLLNGDGIFIPVADIQVAVTGMVKRPAIYEVKPGVKALDVLELAGGLSSNAFKGRVRLDRVESHKRKVVLDISMEKLGGAANPGVLDGDILFVDQVLSQEFDVVYLKGNVNRPGRFEYKKGMNIKDLIPTVKDLKSETFFTYGHIKRATNDDQGSLLLPFSLKDVFESNASVPLMPRDTVIIYSRYDIMDQPLVRASGMVRRPGSYPFVDQMRLSDLIIAAGGLTVDAYLGQAHLVRILKSGENDSLLTTLLKVNLAKIVESPGDENNLEIRPFDSLIVFPRANFILPKVVSIYGAVRMPGDYELSGNMGVRDLIAQAQGLNRNSYKLGVEVVRRKVVGDSIVVREIHQVSLPDLNENKKFFALEDGDGVYVREVINARERSNVFLMGEFAFPGAYEFAPEEKLSSVIRRAGGFTREAYLRGTVFIRRSVKAQQIQHVEEIARRMEDQMQIALEQTTDEKQRIGIQAALKQRKTIIQEIKTAPYLGRVVIALDRKFDFAGGEYDITLENGDSLWIGPTPNTISILGEVYSPTNVIFTRKSNSVGECLALAGGVNEYGDDDNTFYVAPDGTIATPKTTPWYSSFGWHDVEPGGTIIVPPKGPKKDYLEIAAKLTQILYQIAISVGVAKTVL